MENFTTLSTIELDPSDYAMEGGNLYFTRELCDIVCEQDFNIRHYYADYGGEDLFYYVNIYFPTFIPDEALVQSTVNKISIYGDSNPLRMAPIATSEELGRLSLAQSLQLLVSDYTNLWTVAAQGAYGQAELEYTIDITFQSTLWSTILTLPNTLATTGLTGVFAQIATIPIAVASEVYEEIYVDAMIEAFIEGQFDVLGWDAKAGQILSMIITSVREAIMGPGSDFLSNLDLDLKSDVKLDNQLQDHKVHSKILGDIDARIEMNQEILNQITPALSIQLDTMIGVAMSIMGVLMGGDLGVGLNALMPTLIEKFGSVETYANAITLMKSLTPQQRRNKAGLVQYTETLKEIRAEFVKASNDPQLDFNYNLGFIAKSSQATHEYNPISTFSQDLEAQAQTQMESYERNLAISNLYKQALSLKKNQEHITEIGNIKEETGEMVKTIQESLGDEAIPIDISTLPDDAIMVEEVDPLFLLLVRHPSKFKRLFPSPNLNMEQLKLWLAAEYKITYEYDLYYGNKLIDVGQKIGTLDIKEDTTIGEILAEMQYNTVNPDEVFTLKLREDFVDSYFSNFRGIYGSEEIFNYLSRDDKIELYEKLESIFITIKGELEFGGLQLHEIAYENTFNEFLDRNDKYDINGKLDEEWRAYLVDKVWNTNFKLKAMTKKGVFHESYIEVIETSLKASIFDSLIVDAKHRLNIKGKVLTNDIALSEIMFNMEESNIIGDLLKLNLYERFVIEAFLQNFHTYNEKNGKIAHFASGLADRNGALSEALVEFEFMSKVLSEIYELYKKEGNIARFLIPTFSYEYNQMKNKNGKEIFTGPRIDIKQERFLDGGLRKFVVKDGGVEMCIGFLVPVKYNKELGLWRDELADAISGAFVHIRDNFDKGISLNSELYVYLNSLRYEYGGLNLMEDSISQWISTSYDEIKHINGDIKVERRDIFESSVIKAINQELWTNPTYGTDLSSERIAEILLNDLTDPDFVQSKIINIYDFADKSNFNLLSVINYIRNLAAEIDSVYSDILSIDRYGNPDIRAGLSKDVEKSDYFITNVKISHGQLLALDINKIFDGSGRTIAINNPTSTILLDKQYKIITKKDGSSRALLEVRDNKVETPSDYVDGIIVGGKVIKNALLTYLDGRCLLSEFFDPEIIEFGGLEFWINEEFWRNYENNINNEYVDVYTVFSFTERNEHLSLGTLVHLTDPSIRSDNLYYKLTRLEPHFQSQLNLKSRKPSQDSGKIKCDPFAERDSTMVYGEEFTKDVFMRIFYELFDPYTQFYTQRTQTLAMKFLSYLNGNPYGTDFKEFSKGPGITEFNAALKKLGFTESELQAFIWKKIDPDTGKLVFNCEQTKKEWLKLIYDKITSYPYNDGSIYAKESDRLSNLGKPEYHKIDDASIARDREDSTVEEARMGVEIFESAKNIFGHFTIRLMFANMVDYYGNVGSFGIKILNRPSLEPRGKAKNLPPQERQYLRDFLFKIGLIPSTFQYDRPIRRLSSYTSKNDMISTVTFLFGFFFLESHLYLNIENKANVKTKENTLNFQLGPLVALTAFGGFSGKNLRALSKEIGIYLESSFELYRAERLNPRNVDILGRNFLYDQSRTLGFIAQKIKRTIIEGHYFKDNEKNIWLANQLIEHARLGLIYEKTASKSSGYLKEQIDSFMDNDKTVSRQSSYILEFNYLLPKSKKPFKLEITQSELIDNAIVSWGKRALLGSTEYAAFKARVLLQNNHNIRKELKSLISLLGEDEKVRVFLLFDKGDANAGNELITKPEDYPFKILPDGETYIDIDLNGDKDMVKLQHIINLLYTGMITLVVKKPSGTYNDGEMIFALNREGYLELNELYSNNMDINSYSTIFRGDNGFWQKLWLYPKGWSADSTQNSDINSYLHYIDNPKLDNKHINLFMREYMERLEILFSGYRIKLKKYLFFNINP